MRRAVLHSSAKFWRTFESGPTERGSRSATWGASSSKPSPARAAAPAPAPVVEVWPRPRTADPTKPKPFVVSQRVDRSRGPGRTVAVRSEVEANRERVAAVTTLVEGEPGVELEKAEASFASRALAEAEAIRRKCAREAVRLQKLEHDLLKRHRAARDAEKAADAKAREAARQTRRAYEMSDPSGTRLLDARRCDVLQEDGTTAKIKQNGDPF